MPHDLDDHGASDDVPALAAALDAAIRNAFTILLKEPVPDDLQALVDRVRALEAGAGEPVSAGPPESK